MLRPKTIGNVGGLWRSAHALGASLLFTIQDRFPPQARRDLIAADPALALCDDLVQIPMPRSLNVAVTGAVVMYDRLAKR